MKLFHIVLISGLGLAQISRAQLTYFNVPSSSVVEKRRIAVQQQFNISESIRSSTTIDYGLGNEWEVGLNFYNLDYQPGDRGIMANDTTLEKSFSPLLLFNVQKTIDLTKNIELGIGGQAGFNVLTSRQPQFVGYGYSHIGFTSDDEHYNVSVGGYIANARYLGEGSKGGFQAGFDAGIFYQELHLLGDWISGTHDFGQLVLGFEVYLGKNLPFAIGWQRTNKMGDQAVVLQLTYNPQ